MATGASTADVAILLVDARNGVRTQSRRHARIARLLGITDFVLAVNKMDLVDFDRDVFEKIADDFDDLLTGASVHAIPMSALHGDNVITKSDRTPWFDGPPLLEYLETVRRAPQHRRRRRSASRCRSCCGPITSSAATPARSSRARSRRATRVTAWPSGRSARVKRIVTFDGDLDRGVRADVGDADARRRDRHQPRRRARRSDPPLVSQRFEAELVWMDERPLDPGRLYLLKHSTRTVTAEVNHPLLLNQIGTVQVSTARPLVFDRYARQPVHGQLHPDRSGTHFTCGAGMITEAVREAGAAAHAAPLSFAERLAHMARRAASDEEAADAVRKALEEMLS